MALLHGYFPTGVNLSTAIAGPLSMDHPVTARIYLRAPVNPPIFSKGKRKLLRKNLQHFRYEVRDFYCDEEINQLWVAFKEEAHNWQNVPNLAQHIFRNNSPKSYPAKLLTVYKEDKLVAFTVFFEGEKSLASLEAAYDLNYSKYSLGIFTMLLEMKYAHERGKEFYYPGFMYKDVPMFQYKMRLGGLQYFQLRSRQWKPIEELKAEDWVYETMKFKILQVAVKIAPMQTAKEQPLAFSTFIHPESREAETGLSGFTPCIVIRKPEVQRKLFYHPFSEEYIVMRMKSVQQNDNDIQSVEFLRTQSAEEAIASLLS